MDPMDAVVGASRWLLGVTLLAAGIVKARSPYAFYISVREYDLLGPRLSRLVGWGLPFAEIGAGISLLPLWRSAVGAWAAAGLFAVFTAALTINVLRGRTGIDCGCGIGSRQTIGVRHIVRNVAMLLVAIVIAANETVAPTVSGAFLSLLLAFQVALGWALLQSVVEWRVSMSGTIAGG